jgi:hypothetical protein
MIMFEEDLETRTDESDGFGRKYSNSFHCLYFHAKRIEKNRRLVLSG